MQQLDKTHFPVNENRFQHSLRFSLPPTSVKPNEYLIAIAAATLGVARTMTAHEAEWAARLKARRDEMEGGR